VTERARRARPRWSPVGPRLLLVAGAFLLSSCAAVSGIVSYLPRPEVHVASAMDSPETLAETLLFPDQPRAELLVETEPGQFVKYLPAKPGFAATLQQLASGHLGAAIEHVANFEPGNKSDLLLLKGSLQDIRRTENFLASIEALAPQIEIEAKVVEINWDSDSQIGVRTTIAEVLNETGGGNPKTLFNQFTGIFDTPDFAEAQTSNRDFQGNILTLEGVHDDILVRLVIQALVKEGHAELISSPTITTIDGCPAEIVTGDEVPVQQTRVQAGVTFIDINYKKTGVKLNVTPNIVGDSAVQLAVTSEVSTVISFTPAVRGSFPVPIISNRNASTVVNVRNGETFVIGGLITDFDIEDSLKTPILGDIPLLKYLFSTTRTRRQRTQILFFLTPRIVSASAPSARVLTPSE